ncbi:hypothetical protein GE09DRAFT_1224595 [Coniochaeta sp. 2T2.1]|nr:hypothetical protein GE09DRAFT_1224595 [Coniochaeta sp. 2T2.1]
MEPHSPINGAEQPNLAANRPPVTRKRSTSGGLLSKIPFMRSSSDHHRAKSRTSIDEAHAEEVSPPVSPTRGSATSMANALQQQQVKTRRRRGSLRKVALLGRGAQRERRESRSLSLETKQAITQSILDGAADGREFNTKPVLAGSDPDKTPSASARMSYDAGYGLGISAGISDITPRPSMDGYASRAVSAASSSNGPATPTPRGAGATGGGPPTVEPLSIPKENQLQKPEPDSTLTSPTISYSTTDDEDALHMSGGLRPGTPPLLRPADRSSMSSGSDYFPGLDTSKSSLSSHVLPIQRRRSATTQRAKSPLALTPLGGLSTTPLPQQEADWDYSETEWWGWVVLVVTWVVFVVGMGSCLGVWSWAWDVGTTPYAPPELEDDPTLPIVGYYPALIILTGVMAWVWVVVAWVGMKYFRHARVSGD